MMLISADNATTTLAAGISASTTTIVLAAGTGALFPSPAANQYFSVTLNDAATGNLYEVCYCTSRTGDSLTVLRGQEGTTARSWLIGDFADGCFTAGGINSTVQTGAIGGLGNRVLIDWTGSGLIGQVDSTPLGQMQPFRTILVFSASTTWTCPAGVYFALLAAWGGGGGGGGSGGSGACAGGGGGGGYTYGIFGTVPGTVYAINIGAAGMGASGSANGGAGGTTSIGSFLTATGGGGGLGSSSGATGGGSSGNGIGGTVTQSGYPGGSGIIYNGAIIGGTGGGLGGAAGDGASNPGPSVHAQGLAGGFPGVGGNGGSETYAGGNGAPGQVIVRY